MPHPAPIPTPELFRRRAARCVLAALIITLSIGLAQFTVSSARQPALEWMPGVPIYVDEVLVSGSRTSNSSLMNSGMSVGWPVCFLDSQRNTPSTLAFVRTSVFAFAFDWFFFTAALAAVALVPLIVRAHGDRRRFARHLCVWCGYELEGNVSGTCPECGTDCSPDALARFDEQLRLFDRHVGRRVRRWLLTLALFPLGVVLSFLSRGAFTSSSSHGTYWFTNGNDPAYNLFAPHVPAAVCAVLFSVWLFELAKIRTDVPPDRPRVTVRRVLILLLVCWCIDTIGRTVAFFD